ncbi:SDR family NAD(P)-dependent oxidoreductase [Azospirillum agricola]|uniref:SDR family NAD(P)-dependent oxidoreductase n=1 Tax=Azospirillum agricola TaxID=1720247 RepID=UPI000A0EFC07|nr:SDR family NAD(P)-dependent oxidoreductase [Azospirillum agricola]SMH37378.1 Short-chain dehydrogenase [Azospirillum lipoferum]
MGNSSEAFAGGVAVITGAAAGIGEGLTRRASELGMKVVIADISAEGAETLAAELRGKGREAMAVRVDVSRPEELERLAEQVHASWGDVRLLVNNAGIETIGMSWEIPAARWEQTLNINIHGVVHGVRAFAPRMLASGKPACIANLASTGSFGIMPTQTAYIMTKHAIQSFTECLYLEMQMTGKPVQVSTIVPGMVKTRIFEASAGTGEPTGADRHRAVMRELMANYGMDLAAAAEVIFDKLATGAFWIDTQPDMTRDMIDGRIAFLTERAAPRLAPMARSLLGLDG